MRLQLSKFKPAGVPVKSILLIILAGCWLAACQMKAAGIPAENRQVLEDFSTPILKWRLVEGPNGSIAISDQALRITIQVPGYDLWSSSGYRFSDGSLEVDAARLAGPDNNRYGLACRIQDTGELYMFLISSDGYYTLAKYVDGAATLLGQESMAYTTFILQGSATNHLRFDCQDAYLKGWVNGHLIAITSDEDLRTGEAGVIAGAFDLAGVEISFDDFLVTVP
jgi:hypothetical protein